MSRRSIVAATLAAAFGAMAFVTPAAAQASVKVGTLVCNVAGGIGLIITSKKAAVCTFTDVNGVTTAYRGEFTTVGIDIGVTNEETIVWAVFQPSRQPASLAGTYVGATAEATIVAGLGANVLVGGSNKSIALQPLSVSGQTGLNFAAGMGGLTLTAQ